MFEPGAVYQFSYLWAWQFARGEEGGRKSRPVCLVVKTPGGEPALLLFPLTSRTPESQRLSLEVPADELRKCGLRGPCWIMLDEFNRTLAKTPFDFESLQPLGHFSPRFLRRIAKVVKDGAKSRRIAAVPRS